MSFGPIKLQYLLLYAIIGAWMPYLPVYLDDLGMADWQIGWIIGMYGLAVLIMPAIVAAVADRWLSNRTLMAVSYLLSAAGLVAIASASGFWALLVLSTVFSMVYTPLFALTDGITFAAMHDAEEAGREVPPYHRLRVWGSIGFILPAIALFFVMRYAGATSHSAIIAAAVAAVVALLMTGSLPVTKRGGEEPEAKLPTVQAWRSLVQFPVLHLVGPLFLMFVAISLFYVFYTIYLGRLGIGEEWMGLIVNIGVVAEVGLMFISGYVLQWMGLKGVMVAGAAAMVLRLGLLAAVPTEAVAIATQVLHAPIVLALYLVPPMYLNAKASRSYRNSMQGLYGALCFGVARLVGSVIGGYAAGGDNGDLATTFWLGAGLSGVALVWLLVFFSDAPASAEMKRRTTVLPPTQTPEGQV